MNDAIVEFVESSEAEQEVPLGHRLAKAGLAAVAAVVASWGIQKAYDGYLNRDDEDETDTSDDAQE